jgi:GNAT superfamily N-acetyltransferase
MGQSSVNVRPATADDANALARLAGQLGYPTTAHEARDRLEALLDQHDHAVFVAEAEGRATGVGRALVAQAEAWATEHGYDHMVVRSNTLRSVAPLFYPALGYRLGKTQNVFVKDLRAV